MAGGVDSTPPPGYFRVNKSGVQIPLQALFGQKVKGGIWFPKIDS